MAIDSRCHGRVHVSEVRGDQPHDDISLEAILLSRPYCHACRPVYVPSEAKVTYTAGRVLPADPTSLALSNGALNKLLKGREGEGSPAFMSIEDAQEGFLMSECSMFIDAAYTEAQPALKPARRSLQVSTSFIAAVCTYACLPHCPRLCSEPSRSEPSVVHVV